jgi:hypothetical protein
LAESGRAILKVDKFRHNFAINGSGCNPGGEHLLGDIQLLANLGNARNVSATLSQTDCQALGDHNCFARVSAHADIIRFEQTVDRLMNWCCSRDQMEIIRPVAWVGVVQE